VLALRTGVRKAESAMILYKYQRDSITPLRSKISHAQNKHYGTITSFKGDKTPFVADVPNAWK
jgi:hypothetical protein